MSKIGAKIQDCSINCFRFTREKSVNFHGTNTRNRSSANIVMSDPSSRITMCRLLNGNQSMRQSCLETRM